MKLGLLVVGGTHRGMARGSRQSRAGVVDLLHRIRPIAPQLHDLGPMDEALAAERHEVRLSLAPPAESSRPVAGAFRVECSNARFDDRAIGNARDDRIYFVSNDGKHYVFELSNGLADAAQSNEGLPHTNSHHRRGARFTAAARNRHCLAEPDVRTVSIAGHEQWRGPQAPLQNLRRAVAVVVLQKVLDAGVPTIRQYPFTAEAQVHRDIASTFGRARQLTPTGPGPTGLSQPIDVSLVVTGQQRGPGETFKILWLQSR